MGKEHYTVRRIAERNAEIRKLKDAGVAAGELADRFDLSVWQIYRITNKRAR